MSWGVVYKNPHTMGIQVIMNGLVSIWWGLVGIKFCMIHDKGWNGDSGNLWKGGKRIYSEEDENYLRLLQ